MTATDHLELYLDIYLQALGAGISAVLPIAATIGTLIGIIWIVSTNRDPE